MKLSRSQLAKKIGVPSSSISLWETTQTMPSLDYLPKVIAFIGYDPLFDDSNTLKALIENYKRKHRLTYKVVVKQIGVGCLSLTDFLKDRGINKKNSTANTEVF